MTGNLFVIAGPSGVGKSTLEKMLFNETEGLNYSVSATTRSPRKGEVDGKDYFFVSRKRFEEMIQNDEFIEYAEFFGNFYGTPSKFVQGKINSGQDIIIDVEVEGVENLRKKFGDAVYIFVAPPSMNELKKRLTGRQTEDDAEVAKRYDRAAYELTRLRELAHQAFGHTKLGYDYVIINDNLEVAYEELKSIITATRASLANRAELLDKLVESIQ